jgi:hypothetical protein
MFIILAHPKYELEEPPPFSWQFFKHLEKFGKLKNTEATTAVTQASSYNIKILLKTSQIEP